jgi:hypothetical protein
MHRSIGGHCCSDSAASHDVITDDRSHEICVAKRCALVVGRVTIVVQQRASEPASRAVPREEIRTKSTISSIVRAAWRWVAKGRLSFWCRIGWVKYGHQIDSGFVPNG